MKPLWDSVTEAKVRAAGRSLDEQKLPKSVKFCTRCVVSNQRPRITFNKAGVCSACLYQDKKANEIDWYKRESKLQKLLAKHRSNGLKHDVIVPASGGKDSSHVALELSKYGMTPLAVRWAPFMPTDVGRENWQNFCAEFDSVTIRPRGTIHRKLARLGMEFYGDPFLPFIFGQLCAPMREARRRGIPLVMFGENGEAEYGGDTAADEKPCWDFEEWDKIYYKGGSVHTLFNLGVTLGCFSDYEKKSFMQDYTLPPMTQIKEYGIEFHWLGHYKRWHPMENFYEAQDRLDFQTHDERSEGTYTKFASLDDRLDGLHYFFAYVKFGIGRCTSDAAQQVRNGDITREEAVALVDRYDGELPIRYMEEVLAYLGCDFDHLMTVVDRYRPEHLWECGDQGIWRLRASVSSGGKTRHKTSASDQDETDGRGAEGRKP